MKKILAVLAALIMVGSAFAQNTTKIGSAHAVNFGGYAGYSQDILWYGSFLMDINAQNINLRTRVALGLDSVKDHVSPSGAVAVQYLVPIGSNSFFFYPSVGVALESYYSNFRLGPQAILGFEYQINHGFGIFAEGRYNYMLMNTNASRLGGNVGIKFAFGSGRRGISRREQEAREVQAIMEAQKKAEEQRAAAEAAVKANTDAAKAAAAQVPAEQKVTVIQGSRTVITESANEKQITENLLFYTGTSYLDANVKYQIEKVAAILAKFPETKASIKAYADKTSGDDESNQVLSDKRANAVKMYLNELGIADDRITLESFGSKVNPFPTPATNRVVVLSAE